MTGRPASDRGATAVEYALLTALVAIVAIAGASVLGSAMGDRVRHQSGEVGVEQAKK